MKDLEASHADKRNKIIRAAIRTFARKGYHGTRVSDIANEADVAYGLVYHYFKNKEEILRYIFHENWSVFLQVVRDIEKSGKTLREQIEAIVSFILESYKMNPELLEVIILEVTRSPRFMEKQSLSLFTESFAIFERMINREKRRGGIRKEVDVRISCLVILGSLETVVNAFVLKILDVNDEALVEKTRRTIVEIAMSGIQKGAGAKTPVKGKGRKKG